ncbi:unnamed protein product [Phytophthora lilii]|uniref:Unnamed protein product n=1 Tax=Phytophthora lilii TaxID=2077276 RepID=A0A9W6WNA0_9STRA|nr:unnamed protein product [Phytophthora lilii]
MGVLLSPLACFSSIVIEDFVMAPIKANTLGESNDDDKVENFVRHPPIRLSTLDLLARSSPEGITAWHDADVPAKVRREMHQLAKVEMEESLRTQQVCVPTKS